MNVELPISNIELGLCTILNRQSEATSSFDVKRWMFDVGRSKTSATFEAGNNFWLQPHKKIIAIQHRSS